MTRTTPYTQRPNQKDRNFSGAKALCVSLHDLNSSTTTEICPSSSAQIYSVSAACDNVKTMGTGLSAPFEWKQYGNDEPSPSTSKKHQYISEREEAVKEKLVEDTQDKDPSSSLILKMVQSGLT
ncbi:hypothetical protein Prudu_019569 [Prunus dulcis]|uniref:Uncharacterized protein n=1 Tax=Prunus dulcis TaxID=3755 RepID=A0A4Y1RTB7_PRUDU|nr:hypothetical protein Prudu_019569 [Prunus dulcis]